MSNDLYTLYELNKLRLADLRSSAEADRLVDLVPRRASLAFSMHLPNIAALLRRPASPRLAT